MSVYYNEFDPFAAAWLRELIKAKVIAEGEVDERSIEDVTPRDLRGYTQCHFFAGIGVWSHVLRLAGWPDDKPVWTGSCPCQPFSNAGKRDGFADKRHLWPSWFHLVSQCKPDTIFGEQVKAAISQGWLDLVQDDLEGIGYSFGAVPFPACSVGAPHIRQRIYFVAHAAWASRQWSQRWDNERSDSRGSGQISDLGNPDNSGSQGRGLFGATGERIGEGGFAFRPSSLDGLLAHADGGESSNGNLQRGGQHRQREEDSSTSFKLGIANPEPLAMREDVGGIQRKAVGSSERKAAEFSGIALDQPECTKEERFGQYSGTLVCEQEPERFSGPSNTNGFWRDADWLFCTDQKYRPVEPGTFPLVNGAANRVGRLRGYGNAIVAPQAQAFIEAYMEVVGQPQKAEAASNLKGRKP